MAFNVQTAKINLDGTVYDVSLNYAASLNEELDGFTASVGGTPVSDSTLLTRLFGASKALKFLERLNSSPDLEIVESAENLLQQVIALHGVKAQTDYLTNLGGASVALIASKGQLGGSALSSILSANYELLLDVSVNIARQTIYASWMEGAKTLYETSDSQISGIVALVNSGSAISFTAISDVADGIATSISAFRNVTSILSSDELLNQNWSDDLVDFFGTLGSSIISTALPRIWTGPAKDLPLISKIFEYAGWTSTFSESYGQVLEIYENLSNMTADGYTHLNSTNLSSYRNYFESTVPIESNPSIMDTVEVTTGASQNDFSDARVFVFDKVFSEVSTVAQGFNVSLSEILLHDVTFNYTLATFPGVEFATEDQDYVQVTNGTFTIPAGSQTGLLPVTIINDSQIENPIEEFRLQVYDPEGATFSQGYFNDVRIGYIIDDDVAANPNDDDVIQDIIDANAVNPPTSNLLDLTNDGANLVALSFGAETTGASQSASLKVTYVIANSGDEASAAGTAEVFLANSADLQSTPRSAGSFNFPSLDPGEQRTFTREIDLPVSGNGDFFLGVELRSSQLGMDSDATDNAASIPFEIGPGLSGDPNLRVINLSDPTGVFARGDTYDVSFQITTNANGAPVYHFRILYSEDEYYSPDDIVLHSQNSSSGIGSHGVHSYNQTITIPALAPDGIGNLIVVVDPLNQIQERRETDNLRFEEIVVTSDAADANANSNIAGSHFNVDAPTLTVDQVHRFEAFGYLTSPDDDFPAGVVDVHFMLSVDPVIDRSDIAFLDNEIVVDNSIGDVLVQNTSTRVPFWIDPGIYYLGAIFDINDQVAEDNELDNATRGTMVEVINPNARTLDAVADTLFVTEGQTSTGNILSNDTSQIATNLIVLRANNDFVSDVSDLTFTTDNGLIVTVARNGDVDIDAINLNVDTPNGARYNETFTYLLRGIDHVDSDLGEFTIQIVGAPLVGGATDGTDWLWGGPEQNAFDGREGHDFLTGFGGPDDLDGGNGTDTATYSGSPSSVWGGPFDPSLNGVLADLLTNGNTFGDANGDLFTSIENLIGSGFNDLLLGDSGPNEINGGVGNDIIFGRLGADIIHGGEGNDTIFGDDASGFPEGIPGIDFGADQIFGDAGNDNLFGEGGADVIDGGDDTDLLNYETSPFGVTVNLVSGEGFGPIGSYAAGDTYNDIENVRGTEFDDILIGTTGNNTLEGLGGNDLLIGSIGADILAGGADIDTFAISSVAEGGDIITDFNPNGEMLDLRTLFTNHGLSTANPIGDGILQIQDLGGIHTIVNIDLDGSAGPAAATTLYTLVGINPTDVTLGQDILVV